MTRKPIYIHNPKTGTTSVRTSLPLINTPHGRTIHLPIHHKKVLELLDAYQRAFVFMTVRHPLERAVSCFSFWQLNRKRAVPENYVLQSVCQGLTCSEFYEAIDLNLMARVVPHFATQWSFIEQNPSRVNRIVRLETLHHEWPGLLAEFGADANDYPLQHKMKSKHRGWEAELSDEATEKLRDFYAADFRKFGYD